MVWKLTQGHCVTTIKWQHLIHRIESVAAPQIDRTPMINSLFLPLACSLSVTKDRHHFPIQLDVRQPLAT
ncbi:MAG: hypothetical protein ACI89U_001020 [Gammaproteobacteria bacterium]|jgi:hypothetical protein